ncbi:MAG: UDP-N-acetylglucosamine diphosphorylase/glucosamine-phosphate N-acetyltransferase [Haloplasmataceae bacterium]|jgi:bifunctional UDP-N-acetylglucosamine pyrophosphorylase/glucosamine-1-phosphate N-acetyltransferase|nr:UDP-N-acetylglucosamine diphosphorylase/glucosamine-phosphate N-acetyltransferase [Haloplasmataceae bacterium]
MNNAIILAAGKGTRMKSELYKVLHCVLGKPLIKHVVDNLDNANINRKIVVVGHGAEEVKKVLNDNVEFVLQSEQLGTGHAVMMAEPLLKNDDGITIVICGDTPLITTETINNLLTYHANNHADATILTAIIDNPSGYGRIVRDDHNEVLKIVEHKDTNNTERLIKEINTGTYCFNNQKLFTALKNVKNNNFQNEYYLTDVIEIIKNSNGKVLGYTTEDFSETIGINDRIALANANLILKRRINNMHMLKGVTIIDPDNTYISVDTKIESDTIIYPGCVLFGNNTIGKNCIIGPNTNLENIVIGDQVKVRESVISDSTIGNNTTVGPFAHFRNHTVIGDGVRIGNFVEIKNTHFGNNSNAAHLAYIGDAEVGSKVNMGCGTITVNYDGKSKFKTVIGNNVFVGCNSNLVAPINIGDNAYIAAGSTITEDVPNDALAIAREKQTNKPGYANKYKK